MSTVTFVRLLQTSYLIHRLWDLTIDLDSVLGSQSLTYICSLRFLVFCEFQLDRSYMITSSVPEKAKLR